MQTRKIVIASLSLLIVGLALSTISINRAHAFTSGNNSLVIGGTYAGSNLPAGIGSGTIVQAGSTITVTAVIQGSLYNNPAYQRNVTIGFKGDWQLYYQNSSITAIGTGAIVSIAISVTVPSAGSVGTSHSYLVEIWDGPASGNVAGCTNGDGENYLNSGTPKSCFQLGSGSFAILTSDQFGAAQARNVAKLVYNAGTGLISDETAIAQRAQANSELTLGDQSWSSGDFGGAKTHYQNAQNDASAALTTQSNLGGGLSNATIVGLIEGGTGSLLVGIGILLGGFGAFMYFRRRPKA